MAAYHEELIAAAVRSLRREADASTALSEATIRRGVSTVYYALFHFLLDEIGRYSVGESPGLQFRRQAVARTISHANLNAALLKVLKAKPDSSVMPLLRETSSVQRIVTPDFMQMMARTFGDARAKRLEADYDLGARFSEVDARLLGNRVVSAMRDWTAASMPEDLAFKQAVCLLALVGGRLRID